MNRLENLGNPKDYLKIAIRQPVSKISILYNIL